MEVVTYTVELEPLEGGGFSVTVPALPGCVTWGNTLDHAVTMAREAVELWLEDLSENGELIPEERESALPVRFGIRVHAPTGS